MKAFLLTSMTREENYQEDDSSDFIGYNVYFVKCHLTDDIEKHRNFYRS